MRKNYRHALTLILPTLLLAAPAAWGQSAPPAPPAPPDVGKPPADAVKTPSGVYSKILQPAPPDAEKPDLNDLVTADLIAWTQDGQMIQSTERTGKPMVFNLGQVFPGWREVLSQMRLGEKRRIWVPPGAGPPAPQGPQGTMTFDLTLRQRIPMPEPPQHLGTPPADAAKASLGAYSKVLKKGQGTTHPVDTSAVLVHYTGWTTNGRIFDSTLTRFRPTLIPLEKVMPAFAQVMKQMVEGEKRRIWIPGDVARGNWQGGPQGDLTFEVELLKIGDGSKIFADPEEVKTSKP